MDLLKETKQPPQSMAAHVQEIRPTGAGACCLKGWRQGICGVRHPRQRRWKGM